MGRIRIKDIMTRGIIHLLINYIHALDSSNSVTDMATLVINSLRSIGDFQCMMCALAESQQI